MDLVLVCPCIYGSGDVLLADLVAAHSDLVRDMEQLAELIGDRCLL